jgi:hypothetical protein
MLLVAVSLTAFRLEVQNAKKMFSELSSRNLIIVYWAEMFFVRAIFTIS